MVKTRFAPSPTGELHLGSARTALFAYLFAEGKEGEFLLRIEDTDQARLVEGSETRIIESLKWLGIVPQNLDNILVQSKRKDIYLKHALELVEADKAYICECSKERLEKMRAEQEKKKMPPMYDRRCRSIKYQVSSIKELEEKLSKGAVVRMKMPLKGKAKFNDAILDEIEFDYSLQDDPIIIKSDGFATYHLASVVDDHETKISHVIRGVEWLSSTPKHIALYEAFGWEAPVFAHMPVILGPDHKHKLSKRDGDVSVIDFKTKGYLPEAVVNFMALIGWNPKDEREIFTMVELAKEFKLENVNKSPAVFDVAKLNSINEFYIRDSIKYQVSSIKRLLEEFGLKNPTIGELELLGRGGYETLEQMAEEILKLRKAPEYDGKMLIFKNSNKENTSKGLQLTTDNLLLITEKDWNEQELQMQLGLVVTRNNLTNGDVFWPVRVALSGEEKSPSPVELLIALEKAESLKRIEKAIKKLT